MYAYGIFQDVETRYPYSHKGILVIKRSITRFKFYLKLVKFIVRIDLKHMAGMLKNQRLLEKGNNRILRWTLWIDGYDFEI
jgi:hypothetical protein